MTSIIKYDELILSSGGIYGISSVGSIVELNKQYPLKKIKYLTGCSAGALILFLYVIGYSIEEVQNICFEMKFETLQQLRLAEFMNSYGLDNGNKLYEFLKTSMDKKGKTYDYSFRDLYYDRGIIYSVITTNLTKNISEIHNIYHTPDYPILQSLRCSIHIPVVFSPIKFEENYYCDGALLTPYPFNNLNRFDISKQHRLNPLFPNDFENRPIKKIGIWLLTEKDYMFLQKKEYIQEVSLSPILFLKNILITMYVNLQKEYFKSFPKNTVAIRFKEEKITFDLSIEEKKNIFVKGSKEMKKYLQKQFRKVQKKRLLQKYFKLFKFLTLFLEDC